MTVASSHLVFKSHFFFEQFIWLLCTFCLAAHSFLYGSVVADKGTEILLEAVNAPFLGTF